MRDCELDRFKTDIPLVVYASERYGYRRDRRESSRASHTLRHPTSNDKIIVRRAPDGHWTYFSVRDERDHGTIVDFVQRRARGSSLRTVREELRHWLGMPRPAPEPDLTLAAPVRDRRAVAEAFAAARAVPTSEYLARRGLTRAILSDSRFAESWRLDRRGRALFAHHDDAGELTGFEIKGRGFTGFSPGGTKSAWQSAAQPTDRALVVTESAIDALSYAELHPDDRPHSRYLSTAGAPSAAQWALLDQIFDALPPEVTVIAAVDADAAGDALADKLAARTRAHPHLRFRRDAPSGDKDWNDALQRAVLARAKAPHPPEPTP